MKLRYEKSIFDYYNVKSSISYYSYYNMELPVGWKNYFNVMIDFSLWCGDSIIINELMGIKIESLWN